MCAKLYTHKVTISKRRRENKKSIDMLKRSASNGSIQNVFDTYYRDQVRALYRAISGK